jgi:spore maturation protein CgeB
VVRVQSENPLLEISAILEQVQSIHQYKIPFKTKLEKETFEIGLEFASMALHRKKILEEISDLGLHIYGGRDWKLLIDEKIPLHPPVYYPDELPKLYNASKINLNITLAQLKTGINLRPFEVSACEAFIITDYRKDLGELFEIGREIVCYKDTKELRDKVKYYLLHEREREEIAKRAHKRVLKEHTFDMRMQKVIEYIQEIF